MNEIRPEELFGGKLECGRVIAQAEPNLISAVVHWGAVMIMQSPVIDMQ